MSNICYLGTDSAPMVILVLEVKNGICHAGGCSLLRVIIRWFTERVDNQFRIAADPLKAMDRGTYLASKGLDKYQFLER